MRVLVCGGRDYGNQHLVDEVLGDAHLHHGIETIIEGGATGADALADDWAKRNGIDVERFEADWAHFKRKAGPLRNQRMIDEGKPDLVVAFPGGKGTADMVRRAEKAGIPVRKVE